jgi:hypothetical protein
LIFRAYLADQLARSSRQEIPLKEERRMMDEGTRRLGLAEVFARQIVREVAAAMGKRLASDPGNGRPIAGGDAEDLPSAAMAEFLERAAAILTEQRGVNIRSRVLLAAAAESCGLTEPQMERALQLLQGDNRDPRAAEDRQRERETALRDAVLAGLKRLPHRLLRARDEQQWLERGTLQYGLPAERVGELIAEAATLAGVRVISTDKASGHVYELAVDLLDQGYPLEHGIRTRILLEGRQWGLSEDQVDAVLQDVWVDRRRVERTRRRLTLVALGGVGVIGAMLLALIWIAVSPGGDRSPTGEFAEAPPDATATDASKHGNGREWWADHEDLLIAATRVRMTRPDLKDALFWMGRGNVAERNSAYRVLVPAAATHTDLRLEGPLLRDLLSGCLVWEPDDSAADALAESLGNLIPKPGEALPQEEDSSAWEQPFWAVRTILESFAHPGLSDSRGDRLAAALDRSLGIRIDRRWDWRDLDRVAMTALCQHLYGAILAAAPSQPRQAAGFFAAVSRRASRYLDPVVIDQRTADLLTATLPAAEQQWRDYEYLLQFAINSKEPLVVLRMVDLYEQIREPELQEFLAERLLRRARLVVRSVPRAEVARRVREALGVQQPVSQRQRWKQLTALIGQQPVPGVDEPMVQRLQHLVATVHTGTLACALARGETGSAVFDDLYAAGPAVLSAGMPQATPGIRDASPSQVSSGVYRNVLVNIGQLSDTRNRRRESAPLYLRYLATVAPQLPDLPREPAERLARYLLAAKPDSEHQAVLQYAHAITRWPNVRLALADLISDTSASQYRAVELMSVVLGRDADRDGEGSWGRRMRDTLLLEVIRTLQHAAPQSDGLQRIYDDASEILRDAYANRARLLGVPVEQASTAAGPGELLRSIIEHHAAAAAPSTREPSTEAPAWKDWSEKLLAIDYLAQNDLQRLALLQRMWLDLLVAQLVEAGEIPVDQGRQLLNQLADADRQAADVIQQITDAEYIHTQLWLSTRR